MRDIVIEASAELDQVEQSKLQNELPDLKPIIDATQPSKAVAKVQNTFQFFKMFHKIITLIMLPHQTLNEFIGILYDRSALNF